MSLYYKRTLLKYKENAVIYYKTKKDESLFKNNGIMY